LKEGASFEAGVADGIAEGLGEPGIIETDKCLQHCLADRLRGMDV
jgi:hypothetical protein